VCRYGPVVPIMQQLPTAVLLQQWLLTPRQPLMNPQTAALVYRLTLNYCQPCLLSQWRLCLRQSLAKLQSVAQVHVLTPSYCQDLPTAKWCRSQHPLQQLLCC